MVRTKKGYEILRRLGTQECKVDQAAAGFASPISFPAAFELKIFQYLPLFVLYILYRYRCTCLLMLIILFVLFF
ncbi:hypothetical protein L2E82_16592 [Cichorium intybus]|uniref:Uncharacterized protein n=1 Tax=Cichorium intybus TaxID=13427 RepID=A0ACB9F6K2_CICIN|nr:hypothetical protein L2E82_16592 [Cichorium intybus]